MTDGGHEEPEITFEERRLASEYLDQAVTALLSTGDPKALRIKRPTKSGDAVKDFAAQFVQTKIASERRLGFARTSVLFSALAAEAAINFYIAAAVPPPHDVALDGLVAPDRYIVAPRLVNGTDVFLPDREPLGTIRRLFKLRNRLVHPKVGRLRVRAGGVVGTSDYEHFNPATAADMAIAVATAMRTIDSLLADNSVKTGWDLSFDSVLAGEQMLRRAGRTWKDHLPPPPKLRALIRRAVDPPEPHQQANNDEGPSS